MPLLMQPLLFIRHYRCVSLLLTATGGGVAVIVAVSAAIS